MNPTEEITTKQTGNDPVNWFLVFLATVLSAFNGLLSLLSVLVFSGHESGVTRASIQLPCVLWIVSIVCLKLPRSGFVIYLLLAAISIFLCADPAHDSFTPWNVWIQCAHNLRFALVGGGLLLVNAVLRIWSKHRSTTEE